MIIKSSMYPIIGIKSGIRSMGLNAYAKTIKIITLEKNGIRGSR